MGRGKNDTCENCKNSDYDRRTKIRICKIERSSNNTVEDSHWCKHHYSEQE